MDFILKQNIHVDSSVTVVVIVIYQKTSLPNHLQQPAHCFGFPRAFLELCNKSSG